METSLHKQLKYLFASSPESVEVARNEYRIDAIDEKGRLVEIQHAGLGVLRRKIQSLLAEGEKVRIIKPWIEHKVIETYDRTDGRLLRKRKSPKEQKPIHFFGELIHFTKVFPHRNLVIEILPVRCIEKRIDTPRRGRRKQYKSLDIELATLPNRDLAVCLKTKKDLWRLLGNPNLPKSFDTGELALAIDQPKWMAQQVAYVLRHCGATKPMSKRGNSILYKAA